MHLAAEIRTRLFLSAEEEACVLWRTCAAGYHKPLTHITVVSWSSGAAGALVLPLPSWAFVFYSSTRRCRIASPSAVVRTGENAPLDHESESTQVRTLSKTSTSAA